jgi:F420-0:gamma-glutamyl ligase-like protein
MTQDPSTLNPGQLSQYLVEQSHEYCVLSDMLAEILKVKPDKWINLRLDVKSDTAAEKNWERTQDGVNEMLLKLKMKAIEKSMSAIRSRLRTLEVEAKNMF